MSLRQDHTRDAESQREDVLKLLNRRYSKEPLVNVVKDVLKHEQKHRSLVMRDILKLTETLKQVVPGATPSSSAPAVTTNASGVPDPSTLDTKHFKVREMMILLSLLIFVVCAPVQRFFFFFFQLCRQYILRYPSTPHPHPASPTPPPWTPGT